MEKWQLTARPEQFEPAGDHRCWYLRGGRGSGKTRAGAEAFASWIVSNPPGDWAIVAPTYGNARDKCVEGPAGILKCLGPNVDTWNRSLGEIRLVSGARIFLDGADDGALRIQGENLLGAWCDEVSLWKQWEKSWDESIAFAVRIDPARIIATGTPKGNFGIAKILMADSETVVTNMRTADNAENLSAAMLAALVERYEGTRLGRQELGGEILEDVEGALWTWQTIEDGRLRIAPELKRVVVAIDPAATSGPDADETGIVVAGKGEDGQGYILADRSARRTPHGWAQRAVRAYHEFEADRIIAESNNGGEMVELTIRTVDADVPVDLVHASRGKQTRAEPVAALYEQGKVHHVGAHPELESQLTGWSPEDSDSPDRLDANVWALTELMLTKQSSWRPM